MPDEFLTFLSARRNVAPRRLAAPGPDDVALQYILEAAAHAPAHGVVHPWRFILIPMNRRPDLADAFVEALLTREPECEPAVRSATYDKAFHAPCLLAAVISDAPSGAAIPLAEKLISLGCAMQNMLLAAQALHFASGLASGGAMNSDSLRRLLHLAPHEQAVCFMGFGTGTSTKAPRERPQPLQFFSAL